MQGTIVLPGQHSKLLVAREPILWHNNRCVVLALQVTFVD